MIKIIGKSVRWLVYGSHGTLRQKFKIQLKIKNVNSWQSYFTKGGKSFKASLFLYPWIKSVLGNYMFEDYILNNFLQHMIIFSLMSSPIRVLLLFPSAYSITFFPCTSLFSLSFPLSTAFSSNQNVKNQVWIWGPSQQEKISTTGHLVM